MKKIVLLTLAFIICFAMINPTLTTATANTNTNQNTTAIPNSNSISTATTPLKDVTNPEITRLYNESIVTGFPDQTYRPQQFVTRAEAATMIGRALNLSADQRLTDFPDVPEGHYASGYIQSAVEANIITGYPDNTFKPSNQVSREEMAYLLTRALELTETSAVVFTDVFPSLPSFQAINRLATAKITTGYTDGTFKPKNKITRLEFGLLLARAVYPEFQNTTAQATRQPMLKAIVTTANINVRPEPSTRLPAIATLPLNEEINVYLISGNWAYVANDQIHGFVSMSFIHGKPMTDELSNYTIVLDPGHGAHDSGASYFGLHEKDLVLDVSLLLRLKLQRAGANVVMTRDTDKFLTLRERVQVAHDSKANTFISIHANAATSAQAHGVETFWHSTHSAVESKALADNIQKHLVETLQLRNRGVKHEKFHVITNTQMPSVLIELGFMSNPQESAKMKTQAFRTDAVDAIFRGILDFYSK